MGVGVGGQRNDSGARRGRTCEKVGGDGIGGQGAEDAEVCKREDAAEAWVRSRARGRPRAPGAARIHK